MRVLVTGAHGFIGKNLSAHLNEQEQFSVLVFARENTLDELQGFVEQADAVVHLACISNDPRFELNPKLGQEINFDCFELSVKF